MKILITNDDGIEAIGLKKLVTKAAKYGECVVIAPKKEQSGKSHSINIREELEFKQVEDIIPNVKTYYLYSTPADCVRVGHFYLHYDFDVVLSGVNDGYNLGEDIIYSGTCAAATEAAIIGKKGIALSCAYLALASIDQEIDEILEFVFKNKLLDKWNLYNINVPIGFKKIVYSAQGKTYYTSEYRKIESGVILEGKPKNTPDEVENSDVDYTHSSFATITPLLYNRTNQDILKYFQNKNLMQDKK